MTGLLATQYGNTAPHGITGTARHPQMSASGRYATRHNSYALKPSIKVRSVVTVSTRLAGWSAARAIRLLAQCPQPGLPGTFASARLHLRHTDATPPQVANMSWHCSSNYAIGWFNCESHRAKCSPGGTLRPGCKGFLPMAL